MSIAKFRLETYAIHVTYKICLKSDFFSCEKLCQIQHVLHMKLGIYWTDMA